MHPSTLALPTTTALNAALSFGAIPVLVFAFGDEAWASFAVGQSIGLLLALTATLGLGTTGPAMLAGCSPEVQRGALSTSIAARALSIALLSCVFAPLSWGITRDLEAVFATLAFGLSAFSNTWWLVGVGRPAAVLWLDGIPRFIIGVAALGFALNFERLSAFSGGVATANIVCLLLTAARSLRNNDRRHKGHVGAFLRASISGTKVSLLSAWLWATPVILYAVIPSASNQFVILTLMDRVKQMTGVALSPVVQTVQLHLNTVDVPARTRRVAGSTVVGALTALIACLTGLDLAVKALSVTQTPLPISLIVAYSLIIAAGVVSALLGGALLPALGRTPSVARALMAWSLAYCLLGGFAILVGSVQVAVWSVASCSVGLAGHQFVTVTRVQREKDSQ